MDVIEADTPWLQPAVTCTAKTTQTGDSGLFTVHTLSHKPGLNLVYLKYSETEYWAENKTDSIPGTGYSLKPGHAHIMRK